MAPSSCLRLSPQSVTMKRHASENLVSLDVVRFMSPQIRQSSAVSQSSVTSARPTQSVRPLSEHIFCTVYYAMKSCSVKIHERNSKGYWVIAQVK